jgi:cell division septation protein DedD
MRNKFFFISLILITAVYALSCNRDETVSSPDKSQAPAVNEWAQPSKDLAPPSEDHDTGEVIAEPVETETIAEDETPERASTGNYIVQVGAYKNIDYAIDISEKLKAHDLEVQLMKENSFHKVRIEGIQTKEQAALLMDMIQEKFKLKPFLIREHKK